MLDDEVKQIISHELTVMLSDNIKARILQKDGTYRKRELTEPYIDSQAVFMDEMIRAAEKTKERPKKKKGLLSKIKNIFH